MTEKDKVAVTLVLPWIIGLLAMAFLIYGFLLYHDGQHGWAAFCGIVYAALIFGTRKPFDDLQELLERRRQEGNGQ